LEPEKERKPSSLRKEINVVTAFETFLSGRSLAWKDVSLPTHKGLNADEPGSNPGGRTTLEANTYHFVPFHLSLFFCLIEFLEH
jgi:hypothetical protein